MDVGHDFLNRIVQKYGLAIGHLDHQQFLFKRRHKGITFPGTVGLTRFIRISAPGAHHRFISMNLPDEYKLSGFQTAGNGRAIFLDIKGVITDTKTGIQAAVGSEAMATFAGKNSVLDFRKPVQVWKLEK
jgi:hypothetical protein